MNRITITLPKPLQDALDSMATRNRRTRSAELCIALDSHIQRDHIITPGQRYILGFITDEWKSIPKKSRVKSETLRSLLNKKMIEARWIGKLKTDSSLFPITDPAWQYRKVQSK